MFAKTLGLDARDLPALLAELLQIVPARRSPMARADDSLVAAAHMRLLSAVRTGFLALLAVRGHAQESAHSAVLPIRVNHATMIRSPCQCARLAHTSQL